MDPPRDFAYKTVGSFFATQGFITIIADYRLAPGAKFPQPAEDVRDAMLYAVQHVSEGDPNKLFILGHSAGAHHAATILFEPSVLEPTGTQLLERIKGVTFFGGVLDFRNPGSAPPEIMNAYFGSVEAGFAGPGFVGVGEDGLLGGEGVLAEL